MTTYGTIRVALFGIAAAVLGMGCGDLNDGSETESLPGYRTAIQSLEAPCEIDVVNNDGEFLRRVNIEEEYIPGVVACENGGAPLEALKAQAVQARSFLYYKIFVAGQTEIRNSTADQVFSCSYRPNGPDAIHIQAANETKGQYVEWNDYIVASFYVAGAIPSDPNPADAVGSCTAKPGDNDPTTTQKWVTYNWGKSVCNIMMTELGWAPDDCMRNPHNRGCASQNGEACLATVGWKYQDMLKYYYGDDIVLTNADGRCGGPAPYQLTDEDRFCGLKADGAYCMADTVVACEGEFAAMAEVCPMGCEDGTCVVAPTNNTTGNNTTGNNTTGNNTTGNNTTGNNSTNNSTGGTNGPGGANGQQEFPALVDESPGLPGGCSTSSTGSLWPALLLLGLFGFRRRYA